jgi:hypothetical protein
MITAILQNWKRPANVTRIVRTLATYPPITEILIWSANPQCPLPAGLPARITESRDDWGLYARFLLGCYARNDCVLIHDDDLLVPLASLTRLYQAWQRDPDRLHSAHGRRPKADGTYADTVRSGPAPIVLTRCTMAHRAYFPDFFAAAPAFETIQREGNPAGNGEDILLSYVAQKTSGEMNAVHEVPVHELPAPHAIHQRDWYRHCAHRTKLMHACDAWLQSAPHRRRSPDGLTTWEELHVS